MRAVCALAAVLLLAGCSTASQLQVLNNLEGCERHYDGSVAAGMTGGQFTGTVKVDCSPQQGAAVAPH